jgi:hypothetical protein
MSAMAVTLSNRMQMIRNFVCDLYPFRWPTLTQFSGKRTLKHAIGSRVDGKIKDFRTSLLELRKAFVDEAAVVTEVTALQILDNVGVVSANVKIISADVRKISHQLDGMATQLKWVSSHISDAGM